MVFRIFVIILSLVVLGNCGLIPNRWKSQAADEAASGAPSKDNCRLKPDRGPCRAMMKGYWFDSNTKQCKEFVYGGCQGSLPFANLEDCERICR